MKPLITDWIQAIGVLIGVFPVIWGIIKLFIKNKEFEKKIEILNSIVQNQEILNNRFKDQVEELKFQSNALSVRNELAGESNQILMNLIEIQNKTLIQDKEHKEEYTKTIEKDRKSKIKPYFIKFGGSGNNKKYTYRLKNVGDKAIMKIPNDQNTDDVFVRFNFKNNQMIGKDNSITFEIERRTEINLKTQELEISIPFSNTEGDNYIQRIKIKGSEIEVFKPEEN